LVSVVVELVVVAPVLPFFDLWVFFEWVSVVDEVAVFWAFLAAGAAIRKGTATAASTDDVKSFFI
jgi:hypothetical protein